MTEKILHQNVLKDHWNMPIQITHTDQGYYRKRLTPGMEDSRNPHGRPVSKRQYAQMLRIAIAQGTGY